MADLAETGRVGHGRAGHAGEYDAAHDVDLAQAAGDVAHDGLGEAEEAGGDAAAVHEVAGENEKGNGQEGEAGGAVIHPVGQHGQKLVLAHEDEKGDGGHADGHHHRYVQHEKADEKDDDAECQHSFILSKE